MTANPEVTLAPTSFSASEFPLNSWYAAAWSTEVSRELISRTICGKQVAFYRTTDGVPVALRDECWHRLFPLSKGHLHGDNIVCGYHGIEYDSQGRCVFMPSQDTINPSAVVRDYPLVEKYKMLWIWPGDAMRADPALVPDLHWNDDPEWSAGGSLIHARCNYKLVLDNLMDLTHETYVHSTTIGNEHVTRAPFDVVHGDNTVTVTRWMLDGDAPPAWREKLGKPGNVDRWQIIRFEAPTTIVIDVGVALAGTGAPQGDRSAGVRNMVLNTMTPETSDTCHYFWAVARDYELDDESITDRDVKGVTTVFGEDEEVLAHQQRAIDADPGRPFYNLNIDAGAMWARRIIDRRVEAERAGDKPRQP